MPLNGTSLILRLWAGSKVFRVHHTLIFSTPIEVLMPERLEESRGLTVPGAGLLGGTFILCFILCMSAIPDSAASSAGCIVQHVLYVTGKTPVQNSVIQIMAIWMKIDYKYRYINVNSYNTTSLTQIMNIKYLGVKIDGEHSRNVHFNFWLYWKTAYMQCHYKYSQLNQGATWQI